MHAGEAHALLARPVWALATLLNAWAPLGGAYHAPGFTKTAAGLVMLRGLAAGGAVGVAVFNLPAGCRPSAQKLFPAISNNVTAIVEVLTNGDVKLTVGSAVYVALDGICFTTD